MMKIMMNNDEDVHKSNKIFRQKMLYKVNLRPSFNKSVVLEEGITIVLFIVFFGKLEP